VITWICLFFLFRYST